MIEEMLVSEQEEALLAKCFEYFWQPAISTEPLVRPELEAAVAALYEGINLPPPVVIWCESPWQLLTMPIVFQLMNVTSNAGWIREWLRTSAPGSGNIASGMDASGVTPNDSSPGALWQQLWKTIDAQSDAIKMIFAAPSRGQRHHPSFFTAPVTGRSLSCDLEHQYFHDTHSEDSDDYREDQYPRIQRETRDRLRNNIFWVKNHMMSNVVQVVGTTLPRQLTRHMNRQLRSQCLVRKIDVSPQAAAAPWPRLSRATAGIGIAAGIVPSLTAEQLRELAAWTRSQLDLQLQIESDNIFWSGGWGSYYLSQIEFYVQHRQRKRASRGYAFQRWQNLSRGAAMYLFFEKVAFVCDRPRALHLDDQLRLHNPHDVALSYRDGYSIYSWHGRSLPPSVILDPDSINSESILQETNIEVRSVMLERYGIDRFVSEAAVKRDESKFGILWERPLPLEDGKIVVVEVVNATPEPDGTYKHYFLRVHPAITTAREAVAWTFGMHEDDYDPLDET